MISTSGRDTLPQVSSVSRKFCNYTVHLHTYILPIRDIFFVCRLRWVRQQTETYWHFFSVQSVAQCKRCVLGEINRNFRPRHFNVVWMRFYSVHVIYWKESLSYSCTPPLLHPPLFAFSQSLSLKCQLDLMREIANCTRLDRSRPWGK